MEADELIRWIKMKSGRNITDKREGEINMRVLKQRPTGDNTRAVGSLVYPAGLLDESGETCRCNQDIEPLH